MKRGGRWIQRTREFGSREFVVTSCCIVVFLIESRVTDSPNAPGREQKPALFYHTLERGARRWEWSLAGGASGLGKALPDVLVSTLRLRAAKRTFGGRCPGFDAGILCSFSGKEIRGASRPNPRKISQLLVALVGTLSSQRMDKSKRRKKRWNCAENIVGRGAGGGTILS